VQILAQEFSDVRMRGDGGVDARIAAGPVGTDGNQVAVVFMQGLQALEMARLLQLLGRHDVVHHAADGCFNVFPLSFAEFLQFNKVQFIPDTSKGISTVLHHLSIYVKQGGFPELVFIPQQYHNRIINEYIDLMLYRDLTERFAVKHPQLLKYLLKYLVLNLSGFFTVNKLFNDVKSQGHAVSKNTIYDYISYLEEAFIIFSVPIWSRSIRKQAVNPNKAYLIDPAFKYAMSIHQDLGKVFENLIFLELRRRGIETNYVKHNQEVDFYWEAGSLINACYDYSDPRTKSREINGLVETMNIMDQKTAHLITWDKEEEIKIQDHKIVVRPMWKFLLDI
jgi:predicted AAA+ superfamily ATPase